MTIVLITAIFALLLAFVLGLALGFFRQFFAVPINPLIAEIKGILPGGNCGACGFPGCEGYATALAEKKTGISNCPVGGTAVAEKLAALIGGTVDVKPQVAVLACRGSKDKALQRGQYIGVKTCRAARISTGSIKACTWGCQGFGDCVKVCQFGAITMGEDGLPDIDPEKCTGCLRCSAECPQHIIKMVPKDLRGAMPLCFNLNVLRTQVSKNCKNGCIKCEICVKNCPQQCLKMSNGIPVTDYAKCTSCGTCTEKCPVKVMKLFPEEAPVEDLDPA